ncbi:LytR C-terminal domain-containing protein [Azohydromonas lata]|uniref:LytR C-terminal domain-containing protein n=1 Tax=Azohydromonas lata TaxID=45677 RepID=UPI0008336A30|nr:tetratricopeptide repeat protein [Azohydromonas lata]
MNPTASHRAALPLSLALLLALGGCATKPVKTAWRIEPVQTVSHGAPSADGYYAIGRHIERSRDWARAADAYRQALQADPAHVDARNALAVALARLGRLADAEAQLRQALAAAPQRADLHSNLGFLLLLAQRPQEAQAALHTALALDPQDRVAQANLQLAQGRAPATPALSTAQAAATAPAVTAAAKPTPTAAVPAAVAPPHTPTGLVLQVTDQPTLASLVRQESGTPAAPTPQADASPSKVNATAPEPPLTAFTLEISNGMGRRGVAQQLLQQLQRQGLAVQRLGNQPPYRQPHTVVSYRPGHEAAARRVARALPLSAPLMPDASQRSGVRVLLGHDWPAAVQAPGTTVATAAAAQASTARE